MYFDFPDLTPLFVLALIGLIAIAGGIGWLIWFAVHHIAIV